MHGRRLAGYILSLSSLDGFFVFAIFIFFQSRNKFPQYEIDKSIYFAFSSFSGFAFRIFDTNCISFIVHPKVVEVINVQYY